MANVPGSFTPDFSPKALAAGRVRSRHDGMANDCDELEPKAVSAQNGDQRVYCGACRRVLLRWGGEN